MQKPDAFSCAMMALVGAMWGIHGPAIKLAFAAGFTFPQLVFGEYLVGVFVFGLVALWQRAALPSRGHFWRLLLIAAVFGLGVPLFLFWAYQLGPVSIGATLFFLYVPFTQLINFIITRRRPVGREMVSAVLVLGGAVLAANFVGLANVENLRGAPFAILAAFCFATFFVCTARLGYEATPALRSLVCCVVSCGLLFVLATGLGWSLLPTRPAPGVAVLWLIALGVFGQVIPVFLMVHFGPRTGSALGSILTSTELPVAVGVSAWLLGDKIGLMQIGGVLIVLLGIAWPHLPRLTSPRPLGM
jgi:drug/metabolite transporter (DMT)-like permease